MRLRFLRTPSLLSVVFAAVAGCSGGNAPPSVEERRLIDDPPPALRRQLDTMIPLAAAWLNETAAGMRPGARPLTEAESAVAAKAGVVAVRDVRVAVVDEMPLPQTDPLRKLALQMGFANKAIAGGAIGNLVWLRRKHAHNLALLAHELTHVAQQERTGQSQFLRRYFSELVLVGYKRSPLETEANIFMAGYQ